MSDKKLRVQVILEAVQKVTKPLKDIVAGSKGANKEVAALRGRLKELKSAGADLKSFTEAKKHMRALSTEMAEAQKRAQALARELKETENPTRKLAAESRKAAADVKRLKTEEQEHARRLGELRSKLQAAGIETRDMADAERRLRDETAKANRELHEQQDRLRKIGDHRARVERGKATAGKISGAAGKAAGVGAGALAAGAAVALPAKLAFDESLRREDATIDLRQVVDVAPNDMGKLDALINQVRESTHATDDEVSKLFQHASRLKLPTSEWKGFAEDAMLMARTHGMDPADAGRTMTIWRNGLKMSREEALRLGDTINAVSDNNPNVDSAETTKLVTGMAAFAKQAGISERAMVGFAATFAASGIDVADGGKALQKITLELSKGEAATAKQRKAYKAMGLDAKSIAKGMQKDASGAIRGVFAAIAKLPAERRISALQDIFGPRQAAKMAPLLEQLDQLDANLAAVSNNAKVAGSMLADMNVQKGGTRWQLDEVKLDVLRTARDIIEPLKPTLIEVAKWVGKTAKSFGQWAKANPVAVKVLAFVVALVAGLGILALIVAAILFPFAALFGVLAVFGVTIGMVGAAVVSFLAGFVIVGVVVGAAVAIFVLLKDVWDNLCAAAGVGLRIWRDLWSAAGPIWDGIKGKVSGAIDGMKTALASFDPLKALSGAFDRAIAWCTSFLPERFRKVGVDIVKGLVLGLSGVGPTIAVVKMGAKLVAATRKRLDTHSPSRVFAAIGDDVMAGLALGIRRSETDPLARVKASAAAVAAAMSVGASTPAVAAPGASSPGGSRPPASYVDNRTYNITIPVSPGSDPQAIAEAVRKELERRDRAAAAARRSTYLDDDDED